MHEKKLGGKRKKLLLKKWKLKSIKKNKKKEYYTVKIPKEVYSLVDKIYVSET